MRGARIDRVLQDREGEPVTVTRGAVSGQRRDVVKRAGLGVAWHAKPILATAAAVRIDHADLSALLYLQGYREAEILPG